MSAISLKVAIGIHDLFRLGRLKLSLCRDAVFNRKLNRYESSAGWTSWQFGWVRIYWFEEDVAA